LKHCFAQLRAPPGQLRDLGIGLHEGAELKGMNSGVLMPEVASPSRAAHSGDRERRFRAMVSARSAGS
jgi:hypothetical protein